MSKYDLSNGCVDPVTFQIADLFRDNKHTCSFMMAPCKECCGVERVYIGFEFMGSDYTAIFDNKSSVGELIVDCKDFSDYYGDITVESLCKLFEETLHISDYLN